VSLSKNRMKGEAVSMLWNEHAMFAAFSPVDDPEIAIAIVSEHDKVGGGGAQGGPIAKQILEAFYDLKEKRARIAVSERDTKARQHGKPH
jgi:penicillin-binding protein 2